MSAVDRPLPLSLGLTVAELQQGALKRHGDATALVFGERLWSYVDLANEISRAQQVLLDRGLKRGDGLAVLSANIPEVIFINWAAQSLGIRYTPLHPKGSEEDHLFIVDKAEATALFIDGESFGERGKVLLEKSNIKHVFVAGGNFGIEFRAASAAFQPRTLEMQARPEDICNIYFTGGTTGRPKGAAHRHLSVNSATLTSLAFWDWPEQIRFLIATPISHAAGGMLTPTALRGGEFHVLPRFDPQEFLETVERKRITATFVVPSMIYDLLDKVDAAAFDLSNLEMIIYGASPISPARLQEAIERFGPKFCQLYGQTEAPNLISYLSKADHDLTRPERLSSCGIPLAPNQVKLLREDGSEAPQGEPGEICVRGPLVMDSYWKNPDETRKAFEHDWLHTGDVARQDEQGYLYIVDRVKDMVISGGFNVFTREVEDCLTQHPAVAAAAVIGVPHPRWGEAVAAFVQLKPGRSVDPDELIELVKLKKGAVQAPKTLEFVDALPLTAVGKVDKKALRARFWSDDERRVG
jgi:fatty-acyl-CoA synthase